MPVEMVRSEDMCHFCLLKTGDTVDISQNWTVIMGCLFK